MVTNITSLTGNGLKDWFIQRVSAVYLAGYFVFLLTYLLVNPSIEYTQWQHLFTCVVFQCATVLALLMITLHAWIGIWTVTTDYMKSTACRITLQMLVAFWLLSQFVWGLMIVWGR